MPTQWIYRVSLIVAAADQDKANETAAKVGPGGPAEARTFTVPLSVDGTGEPSHFGAYGLFTTALIEQTNAAYAQGLVPSIVYYTEEAATGILVATDSPTAQASIGLPWSWAQSLADAGLQVIRPGLPGMG